MRKTYIKPAIAIITQQHGEGLMATLSIPYSGTTTDPGDAKPSGYWDNPVAPDDTWGDTWSATSGDDF